VTDAILREKTFRTEAVNVHKNGRQIPVEISASTMELDGRAVVLAIVRDITERKRSEVALAESENRYRTLFNDSLMGIYRTSPDGQILLANPALVRMLGYDSFAQVAERNLETDGSGPEYKRDEFKHRLEREGRIVGLEVSWQTRDGRTLFVRENARVVRGPDGAVLYYEGTVEDISDRKAAEQALRQEKELAHSYLEVAGVILVVLDETGAVKLINQKGCAVLGGTCDDIVGRNWFDTFVPERLRDQVRQVFAGLMSGQLEPVEYYENPVVTLRGEERLVVWHNALLRDQQGRPTGTLSSGEDVTERERAVQALRESEEKYRSVVERASDGICIVQDGRLRYLNPRLAEMVGYEPEELVGKQFAEYLHPDDRAAVADRYRRRSAGGAVLSTYSVRFLPRGGGEVSVEANVGMATYEGAPAEIVLVRDVTERERLARVAEETADELRAVLDNSSGAIAAECEGKLVYANQRFVQMFGYESPDQVVGRPAGEFDAPEDRAALMEYSGIRERGGDAPTSYVFRGLKRDGTIAPMEARISTYRSLGRLHILASIHEIEPGCDSR
jgi:PAS domain S-box-containing protein